jgi:hypothetical protein
VPTFVSTFGSQIDDPVCRLHHVHVVLNDEYCVSFFNELLQSVEEPVDVVKMKTCRGLIKNEKPGSAVTTPKIGRKFEALGFAPRQRVDGLAKPQVTEAYIDQGLQRGFDFGLVPEKGECFTGSHGKNVVYVSPTIPDVQNLFLKALSATSRARDENVGEKLHFDLFKPFSPACFTPSCSHIE